MLPNSHLRARLVMNSRAPPLAASGVRRVECAPARQLRLDDLSADVLVAIASKLP